MSIASDAWIRRMAIEHKMIQPFVEGQVAKGKISYGVSSYGYDVRVGRTFKIFHNLNSTLVDPKAFDAKSFVDHVGDACIIPPNSFVLAETVERFRIPRNVLCVCLGKCVTGDTRVVDAATGDWLPIAEFAGRRRTVGLDGWRTSELAVSDFVPQGRRPVFRLRTRLGLEIRATANHPFRQLHGWTALEDLRVGDRIAAAREVPVFGSTPIPEWEAALLGLMVSEGQCVTPGHSPVFTNEDPVLVDLATRCATDGLGVEVTSNGRLGYRLVNHRGRGGVPASNRASAWLASHDAVRKSADKTVPSAIFRAPREGVVTFLRALFSGDGSVYRHGDAVFLEYSSMSRTLCEEVRHLLLRFGIVSLLRSKRTHLGTTAYRVQITDRDTIRCFLEEIGFWPGTARQIHAETDVLPELRLHPSRKSNFDTLPSEAWGLVRSVSARIGRPPASFGVRGVSAGQSMPRSALQGVLSVMDEPGADVFELATCGPVWDVVESIEPAGEEEVFDLTIPGAENFLANDLVVHNSTYARCGIIVNVTPLEPEWEGIVTIEISNTTPLPAKIYANEGIAQILFFKSDPDDVCRTSYRDRKGKYQNQKGLTLPKVLKKR